MNDRPQPAVSPLVVLTILALIPAVLLWAVWQWADDRAAAVDDAVPEVTGTTVPPPAAEPALNTGLLSFRRTAGELSRDLNLTSFQAATAPLMAMVDERSCAAVSLDGLVVGQANPGNIVIRTKNAKVMRRTGLLCRYQNPMKRI